MNTRASLLTALLAAVISVPFVADTPSPWPREKTRPDASQGAVVAQVLGVDTWVQIAYHRPALRGRDVWTAKSNSGAMIVPRNSDPHPWRAGANEVTTIELSADVLIEALPVPAGKYALFMIPSHDKWTVVLSKTLDQAGSGREYNAEDDLIRFNIKPQTAPVTEFLSYGFSHCEANSTVGYMQWGSLLLPFKIEVHTKR
jgi:hypothetical protein